MSTDRRGSEKLMSTCSGMTALSQEELEQVAGAAASSYIGGSYSFWKVFPHGQPWPELFQQIAVDKVVIETSRPAPSCRKPGWP